MGLDGLTLEMLQKAFREKVSVVHPDAGGTPEQFIEARDARDRLFNWVQAHAPRKAKCQTCNGTGFKTVARGFATLKVPCPDCKGKIQ